MRQTLIHKWLWDKYNNKNKPRANGDCSELQARPEEIGAKTPCRDGAAVSAGIAEGRTCLVRDLREASVRLGKGDVLVTAAMGVEWTGLLAIASALVIEKEVNMLSHLAVLAREYGTPAVGA